MSDVLCWVMQHYEAEDSPYSFLVRKSFTWPFLPVKGMHLGMLDSMETEGEVESVAWWAHTREADVFLKARNLGEQPGWKGNMSALRVHGWEIVDMSSEIAKCT